MNRNLLSAMIVLVFATTSHSAPEYSPVTGNWYERIDKQISWVDAQVEAASLSYAGVQGHLATITSDAENWWIVNNLGGELTLDCWLGGYLENGNWKWVSGESWSYTNWWPNEPSGDGNALQFDDDERFPSLPGYWNDLDRNNPESGYIVEYSKTPVPLPSAIWLFGSGLAGIMGYIRIKGIRCA